METEEIIKLVDGIYKNILEKFNPGARQLIGAGKSYLKALHGAADASRLFNEALAKIAVNAQQGGTSDIGAALMNIVGVYKEIQDQHMNILKAFYVDLLVPLETNLEKDTKVVQFEQKKFLQQHKIRADSYSKATATMKKHRKKKNNTEKELKSIQAMEEEKQKLDAFCEQSLKNAMTQERRRYGFVLERQCSLVKHWMAYHQSGYQAIESSVDNWNEIAATREFLPPNIDGMFARRIRDHHDDDSERGSITSALRKTRSIDASCMDMRSLGDCVSSVSMQMPRAKSEFNLNSSPSETGNWDRPIVRALFAYLSSGENQLSFLEGDRIALVGDRAKGWQFGENLRTQKFGWFPIAYTENEMDENESSNWGKPVHMESDLEQRPDSSLEGTLVEETIPSKMTGSYHDEASPSRMFGDTIQYRQAKPFQRLSRGDGQPKPGPPPTLPAPVPTPTVPQNYQKQGITQSHSFSSSGGAPMIEQRKPATMNFSKPPTSKPKTARNGITSASLHSSNDSGFSNEPPPQPEVDYSDEEPMHRVPIRASRSEKSLNVSREHMLKRMSVADEIYGSPKSYHHDNARNVRQAASYGNLTDNDMTLDFRRATINLDKNGKVKRNKSFWRFSKSEEILEGMAMWKHRDLIPTDQEKRVDDEIREVITTLKRTPKVNKGSHGSRGSKLSINSQKRMTTLERPSTMVAPPPMQEPHKYLPLTKTEIDERISKQKNMMRNDRDNSIKKQIPKADRNTPQKRNTLNRPYKLEMANDEQIYGESDSTLQRRSKNTSKRISTNENDKKVWNGSKMKQFYDQDLADDPQFDETPNIQDMNFYDDDSLQDIMMKSIKRQDILKQYYSSGTDTERLSTSSDPYDCIVVEDHLVSAADLARKNKKNKKHEEKMEFTTFRSSKTETKEQNTSGSLLPRTKLSKSSDSQTKYESGHESNRESQGNKKRSKNSSNNQSKKASNNYSQWVDLWGNGTAPPTKIK